MTNTKQIIDYLVESIISTTTPQSGHKIIAICGWAATGKSSLAKGICHELQNLNISASCLSTDSFLIDRTLRKQNSITGYNPQATHRHELESTISAITQGQEFDYLAYDSKTGVPSGQKIHHKPVEINIIEGVQSFAPFLRPHIDLAIAIKANDQTMNALRIAANLGKCGLDLNEASKWLSLEHREYSEYIAPLLQVADIVLDVDSDYFYTIADI